MRGQPAQFLTGHLLWSVDGTVWATWRLQPVPYGSKPAKDKELVRGLHELLFRSLRGEALLIGAMAVHDPTAVVDRMLVGIEDLGECPEWAAECQATLDRLDGIPLGERTFWLSVPMANRKWQSVSAPAMAGFTRLSDSLALPRKRPGEEQIRVRYRQADELEKAIPALFKPSRVSVAEQVWLATHGLRRGLVDLAPPVAGDSTTEHLLAPKAGVMLPEPLLDEGGRSDLTATGHGAGARSGLWAAAHATVKTSLSKGLESPLARRFLKVVDTTGADHPASYQVPMVLADTPAGGMTFPGSEILAALDRCGVDADWVQRLTVTGGEVVLKKVRTAVRNLNDQLFQREGEDTTGQHELDLAARLLSDYQASFVQDKDETQVSATTIITVAGATATEAAAAAAAVTSLYAGAKLRLDRPIGGLTDLWWQCQPGVATSALARRYARYTTATDFACMVQVTAAAVGDPAGILVGLTRSTSRPQAVHLALDMQTIADQSASIAACGELGSGKSYLLKTLAGAVADRGGQVLVIDRSREREYAGIIHEVGGVIVDLAAPQWSLDPLRVLGVAAGSTVTQSFLSALTGITARSEDGDVLATALSPAYLRRHQILHLPGVVDHLMSTDCTIPGADVVARRLGSFAGKDLGAVVFDPDLQPLPLTARGIVWATNAVDLPTPDDLTVPHLFDQMSIPKIFGHAVYGLFPHYAQACSAAVGRGTFTLLVADEAHALNGSADARAMMTTYVREGRRANHAAALGSHDAEHDFGDEVQRGLIRTRIVLRHTDKALATKALVYLGLDEDDPGFADTLEALMTDTSPLRPRLPSDPPGDAPMIVDPDRRGEGWLRSSNTAIEPVRLLGPARPGRLEAVRSTPGGVR